MFPFEIFQDFKKKFKFFFGPISPDPKQNLIFEKLSGSFHFVSYTSSRVKMSVEYRCTDINRIVQNINIVSQTVDKCVVSSSFNMWYPKIVAIRLQ